MGNGATVEIEAPASAPAADSTLFWELVEEIEKTAAADQKQRRVDRYADSG